MKKSALLIAGLLISALMVWWWVDPIPVATAVDSPDARSTNRAAEPHGDPRAAAATQTTPDTGARRRQTVAPDPRDSLTITLLGRCVDERSQPIDAVTATLSASKRINTKARWHKLPAQTTGSDGRFRFRFVAPEGHQFDLKLRAAGRVVSSGYWFDSPPSKELDLGDITLHHGRRIAGRVVDSRGQPRQAVRIQFGSRQQYPARVIGPVKRYRTTSAADGSFGFDLPVLAGHYLAKIYGAVTASPCEFDIAEGPGKQVLEIVVVSELDLPTIRGIVVDESGVPVPMAQISTSPSVSRQHWFSNTRDNGEFTIAAGPKAPRGPLQIHIQRDGYESFGSTERHAWGAHGLRLVLKTAAKLRLRVSDATTGAPIEEYRVWVSPRPGFDNPGTVFGRELRAAGPHPNGETEVTGLRRGGTWLIKVLPTDPRWLESEVLRFQSGDTPGIVEVRLVAPVTRTVQLAFADGRPAIGSLFELLQPATEGEAKIGPQSHAVRRGSRYNPASAYQHWTGRSDASGELQIRGPAGIKLTARVRGPGHLPRLEPNWLLEQQPDPIRITVTAGASLSGEAQPSRFLSRLREICADTSVRGPGLRLARSLPDGGVLQHPHGGGKLSPFDSDGSFSLTGIPPGDWRLYLVWSSGSPTSWAVYQHYLQDLLGLREGQRHQLQLDLSHLEFATVSGRVYLDGKPIKGSVSWNAIGETRADGGAIARGKHIRTGDDGRFQTWVLPGRYRARVNFDSIPYPIAGTRSIRAGEHLVWDLRLRSQQRRFQVVDHRGQPSPGITLHVGTDYPQQGVPPTDALGRTSMRLPQHPLTVWVLPNSLRDQRAQQAYRKKHQLSYWKIYTEVARLTQASETTESAIRIQLPEAVTK